MLKCVFSFRCAYIWALENVKLHCGTHFFFPLLSFTKFQDIRWFCGLQDKISMCIWQVNETVYDAHKVVCILIWNYYTRGIRMKCHCHSWFKLLHAIFLCMLQISIFFFICFCFSLTPWPKVNLECFFFFSRWGKICIKLWYFFPAFFGWIFFAAPNAQEWLQYFSFYLVFVFNVSYCRMTVLRNMEQNIFTV